MSSANTLTGAQVVSLTLLRYGTRTVFSVAGGSHARLLAAMQDDGWTIVSNRHETGSVGGADGYSRVTRRLGVAVIIAESRCAQRDQRHCHGVSCVLSGARAGGAATRLVGRSAGAKSTTLATVLFTKS